MSPAGLAQFGDLSPAETTLVAGIASGGFDRLGIGRLPDPGDQARAVRADLIRFLLLGGADAPAVHEKGIRLGGAWIIGTLDFEGCRVPRDIGLLDCRFDAVPVFRSAVIDTLSLDGSHLPGFAADRLEARGDLLFRAAHVAGPISLRGAQIGGDLVFDGATLDYPGDRVMRAERISVRGGALFRGSVVRGALAWPGARINGDLDLTGIVIDRADGAALESDSVTVTGDISLRQMQVAGSISIVTARVGGDVHLSGGTVSFADGIAVNLNRSTVTGGFFLRDGARIDGALSLNGAELGAMIDDPACWPGPGNLLLNRCLYGAILGSDVGAERRLDWLSRQSPERWGEDFWPQPYEQLARVLGEMGHDEEKRRVLIARERLQRRARRKRAKSRLSRAGLRALDALHWLTTGYGRMPLLAIVWMFVFWGLGTAFYAMLDRENALRPNSPVILRSPEWVLCGIPATETVFLPSLGLDRQGRAGPGQKQLACYRDQPEAAGYPKFNAAMLSADAIILGLGTGQKDTWSPDTRVPLGYAGKWFVYFQTVAGLALGLLAVAGFSGIVKTR